MPATSESWASAASISSSVIPAARSQSDSSFSFFRCTLVYLTIFSLLIVNSPFLALGIAEGNASDGFAPQGVDQHHRPALHFRYIHQPRLMGIAAFQGELARVFIDQGSPSEIQPMPLQVAEPLVFVLFILDHSTVIYIILYNWSIQYRWFWTP